MIAGVVVMHMADDHVLDSVGLHPDRHQPIARRPQKLPPAFLRHRLVKTGIEDNRAISPNDRPDKVVERHRPIMRIATEKILARAAIVMRVADGVDLVSGAGHCALRGSPVARSYQMSTSGGARRTVPPAP